MLHQKIRDLLKKSEGIVIIWVAIMMFAFVGLLALVLDLGHLHAVRNELQNATDAGALAGARALFPLGGEPGVIPVANPNCTGENGPPGATQAAIDTTKANRTDGATLAIVPSDITVKLGRWDWGTNTFTENTSTCTWSNVNAVQVTAGRTGEDKGVLLTLARIFGVTTADSGALSTAAIGTPETNCTVAPLGICKDFYDAIHQDPEDLHVATFRTSSSQTASVDEVFYINPCPEGNPSARDMIDWICGGKQMSCFGSDGCVDKTEGNLESVIKCIKSKVEEALGNPNNPATYTCKDINGGEHTYQGWLITIPVLNICKGTGTETVPDSAWKTFAITKVYEPSDLKDAPQEVQDKCSKSQKACLQFKEVNCVATLDGQSGAGGGTTEILFSKWPVLVQ